MRIRSLHRWPRTVTAALALQRRLARSVCVEPLSCAIRFVAGADVAITRSGQAVIAGVVVWNVQERRVVTQAINRSPCRFPYVPGLLSFRELPCTLAAFRRLRVIPDAVLCDAQGLAHPRRCGLACHLGLWLNLPTVGCAKSRLLGEYAEPPGERGAYSPLWHEGEQVGVVLRTRASVKPVFVSPGHRCDFAGAVQLVLETTGRFRLPEPLRLAHQLVTAQRATADASED